MVRESLLVMTLGASLAGCLGPVPISLPAIAPAPLPEQGPSVSVMVSDERSEKSPARIGVVLANNRDFVLEGNASLAASLENELVSALRTRGYRADHARDAHPSFDVSLLVRVVRFAADVPVLRKVRFEGRSVLVAHVTESDAAGSVWNDVIDTREDIARDDVTKLEAGELVKRFFQKTAADLADRVSVRLPPSRGGL
jgi:uncharacterized lipoprotein YajG